MNNTEWGPSSRRRKKNSIDILHWTSVIKKHIQRVLSAPNSAYYLSISVFVILVTVFSLIDISTTAGKIHAGVQIAGFDVGGLTKKEAIIAIQKRFETNKNKKIKVEYKKENAEFTPSKLEFVINYRRSVESAFNYGRSGSLISKTADRFLSWFRAADLRPDYKLNDNRFNKLLHDFGGGKHKPAVNASIRIVNAKPVLVKSKNGFGINSKKAEIKIIAGILNPRKVFLTAEKLFPDITEDDAKQVLADSRLLISSPVVLKSGEKKWIIGKEKLISLFKAEVRNHKLFPTLDEGTTIKHIKDLTNSLNKEPRNAKFSVYGIKASVIASSDGAEVNNASTYKNLLTSALKAENRIASAVVKKVKPDRTTEEAKKMGIKEMVSTFTTNYPAGKPRVKNIHRLAELLDGMLIAPGETFSFNGRIGKRTTERGFVAAPEIRDGEFIETVGGGICQVSTTVFNTALLAGFPIGERSPHSLFIKKYPSGRDAAVSFPKPDLTFTNDTKTWILIKGGYTATSISISFYGTDYGREVAFITKFLGSIPFPTKEVKDPTLEKGKKKEEKKGVPGKRYHVIRIVTVNGKEIRRTNIHSTFNPIPRVVRVGTKKPEKKEEE